MIITKVFVLYLMISFFFLLLQKDAAQLNVEYSMLYFLLATSLNNCRFSDSFASYYLIKTVCFSVAPVFNGILVDVLEKHCRTALAICASIVFFLLILMLIMTFLKFPLLVIIIQVMYWKIKRIILKIYTVFILFLQVN